MELGTPEFIKSLLVHNGKAPADRKAWSIGLQQVWMPFFTATNVVGDTQLPRDVLGYPIRLGYDKDGSVRFSKTGRPMTKVVKELAEHIRMVRENFIAGLVSYSQEIATSDPDGFTLEVQLATEAGKPLAAKDAENLAQAQAIAMEKSVAEAEALIAKAKPKGKVRSRDHEGELAGAIA